MQSSDNLRVELAHPADSTAVCKLIIEGLTERWGQYEPSFNPDLTEFADHYKEASVYVARVEGALVGCGILIRESDEAARIVRMSVKASHRRTGIGSAVLEALVSRAQSLGYKEIVLETTATWESAVTFYQNQGFNPTCAKDGDQHFRLHLGDSRSE